MEPLPKPTPANGVQLVSNKGSPSLTLANILRRFAVDGGPTLFATAVMTVLIFGGCCSNVYALEAIINFEPTNGTLVTFVQFLFVAITGYVAQFDKARPPFFLTPNVVPLRRWLVNILLFFSINVLNNHAFSYNISVPVHIILRSGGSITTMAAGYLCGKTYSRVQIFAVFLLSIGVSLAAWSDSKDKKTSEDESESVLNVGLLIIFVAQVLSAIMGLYTEATYRKYGPQWKENLFYSHILSLPLFVPFMPSMRRNLVVLSKSTPLELNMPFAASLRPTPVPSQLAYLVANVLTQYACIRGVNLLAANASALTVTIILSIRKLMSLLLSIWLFGNTLSVNTILSAVVVFGAAALYSVGPKPAPIKEKKRKA
ncbi:udp n-acetylglucosamine transporter mnn2 [Trichoderma cornu-damae]|uniref:Udp n-acetylglucosamine transporter mnn2 n=1 Tax=Trichoderma cornu-damae TaxID=654480 RepID=A0A9P8QKZ9_9HYPO|nr:udp n-acetylglucosamine transporter mnn2 [Trichoderma cornu-damae]